MRSERQSGRSRWTQWLPAIALLLVSWVWVGALVVQPRVNEDVVAVIFPPWWNTDHSLAAVATAGAAIVRAGGISSIVVVRPAPTDGLDRLRDAGAWLTVDPKAVGACFAN